MRKVVVVRDFQKRERGDGLRDVENPTDAWARVLILALLGVGNLVWRGTKVGGKLGTSLPSLYGCVT